MANYKRKPTDKLVGKIGWCDAETLGLDVGHYVFIRRIYGNKCSVNTFTSLINNKTNRYTINKFDQVKNGTIYPIPTKDTTLPRFGGVHNNVITQVPLNEVRDIGKYSLKRRHHHYIQKYVKK